MYIEVEMWVEHQTYGEIMGGTATIVTKFMGPPEVVESWFKAQVALPGFLRFGIYELKVVLGGWVYTGDRMEQNKKRI